MAAGQVTRREVQRASTAVSASSSPGRKLRLCLSVRDGSSGPNGWEIQGEKFQLGTRKNILTELFRQRVVVLQGARGSVFEPVQEGL